MQVHRYHSGPLPSPEDLARYGAVDPDAVPAILGTFTEQARHRRAMESDVVRGVERRADRGQVIGAFLVGLGIVGGCVVALAGDGFAGVGIVSAAFASAAVSFVAGGRPASPE